MIGKVFWAGAVAAMGSRDPRAVIEALHELSRKELVRPTRVSSMEAEAEYAFWHILVRDVAYTQIPRAARAEKHRRAAAWIEAVAGERVEDHAEILAHHYTTALELARAARNTDVTELEATALRFLVLAGERALGLDTAKAEASLAKALDLAPPQHPERPAVLVRWADAARQLGRHGEAVMALEEAINVFRERGDLLAAARALTTLANVLWWSGTARSRQVAIEATAVLQAQAPGPDLAAAYAELARQEVLGGDLREGIGSAERALSLAADLGLEASAKALGYRALGRCWLGDAGGLDDFDRALSLALAQGRGFDTSVLQNNRAISIWPIVGPAASVAAFREGIEFAGARGIAESAQIIRGEILDPLADLGSWDEVLESGTDLADHSEAGWTVPGLFDLRRAQVRVLVMRGDAAAALPLAKWAVGMIGRVSADRARIGLCLDALASNAIGDAPGARAALVQLGGDPRFWEFLQWPAYLPAVVRLAVALGELTLGERLSSHETTHPYRRHAQVAASAILAEGRGETEKAAGLYADAAERWERFGVVPERAFALLGQGRCLLALGRTGEASEPLRQAREIFAGLGAKPALAETEALLERTTALAS